MKQSILLICPDYIPNFGGISEMSYNIALGLYQAGWRVIVIAPEGLEDEFDSLQPFETMRIITLNTKGLKRKAEILTKFLGFMGQLYQIVETKCIFYILITDCSMYRRYIGYLQSIALKRLRVRKGILFHGMDVETVPRMPMLKRRLFRNVIDMMDDVFCNSHFTLSRIKSVFGASLDPCIIGCGIRPDNMPPPVDRLVARRKLGIDSSHVILTVARLVPRKGIDMVIRSLKEVLSCERDLLYIVAGGGNDMDRLRSLVKELDCEDHVRFEGSFDNDMLAHYYCASDLFVMPSRHIPGEGFEGFGIVYVEAGHYGLPVIGGRAGGVPDAIIDGHTGILVNPEDPHEIAKMILKLLGDPELRLRLGSAGRARVKIDLNWDAVTKRIIDRINSSVFKMHENDFDLNK